MDAKVSKTIYIVKAFAVFSIICAHCGFVNAEYSAANLFCSKLLDSIGSIGVGIFLFLSGYLFYFSKHSFGTFFGKKLTSLLVPWFFCGTLVYLYVYLRKGGLSLVSLVKWLVGMDTYLYYMSVLTVLYLLCFFIRKRAVALWIAVLVSLACNIWNSLGNFPLKYNYINPMAFLIYFALGALVAYYGIFEKLIEFCRKIALPATVLFFAICAVLASLGKSVGYFKVYYIPVEAVAFAMILGISAAIADKMSAMFTYIGKTSFSIYLLHMPIAGIVANIFNRVDFFALTLLRPIVVLAIVCFAVWAVNRILPKGKALNLINTLIGMR